MSINQNLTDERNEPVARPKTNEAATTAEISALARHRDPSLTATAGERATDQAPRGVMWVRPTELVGLKGGAVTRRGIDFQTELARRTRRLPAQAVAVSRRGISRRTHRLPPVSAFGNRGGAQSAPIRSTIGRP